MTLNTLETLYTAKAQLEGGDPFSFMTLPACTCGHIYRAATGERWEHDYRAAAMARQERFRPVIQEAARALGWSGDSFDGYTVEESALWHVSNATKAATETGSEADVQREHAIEVIDRAIKAIEAEQERNRLDVLAQARAVVDNAAPELAEVR